MDRKLLERCTNVEELAKEIWRQSYEISKLDEEYGKYDEGKLYGFYLRPIKKIRNTPFDIYFYIASSSYCKIINEHTDEGRKYDGALEGYEVLVKYLQGGYYFKYVPTSCEEFIEWVFDYEKAEEISKYLIAILQRLTKNALYCSKTRSSISETKYYTRVKDGKEFMDIIKFEMDKPYEYTVDDGVAEANSHKVVDEFLFDEGKACTVEDEVFANDDENEGLYRYLYNNILTPHNKTLVDNTSEINGNRNHSIRRRLAEKYDLYDSINLDSEGKVKFGGDYISFGQVFMLVNLQNKFDMLKNLMNKKGNASNTTIDIIYSLDCKVIKEFVYAVNSEDESVISNFCNSKEFRVIIDVLLDEFIIEQNRVKKIYMFGEQERLEKVRIVEEYIRSLENKQGHLRTANINKIYNLVDKEFGLKTSERYKKTKVNTKFKLEKMKELGFIFEEVGHMMYSCDIIC